MTSNDEPWWERMSRRSSRTRWDVKPGDPTSGKAPPSPLHPPGGSSSVQRPTFARSPTDRRRHSLQSANRVPLGPPLPPLNDVTTPDLRLNYGASSSPNPAEAMRTPKDRFTQFRERSKHTQPRASDGDRRLSDTRMYGADAAIVTADPLSRPPLDQHNPRPVPLAPHEPLLPVPPTSLVRVLGRGGGSTSAAAGVRTELTQDPKAPPPANWQNPHPPIKPATDAAGASHTSGTSSQTASRQYELGIEPRGRAGESENQTGTSLMHDSSKPPTPREGRIPRKRKPMTNQPRRVVEEPKTRMESQPVDLQLSSEGLDGLAAPTDHTSPMYDGSADPVSEIGAASTSVMMEPVELTLNEPDPEESPQIEEHSPTPPKLARPPPEQVNGAMSVGENVGGSEQRGGSSNSGESAARSEESYSSQSSSSPPSPNSEQACPWTLSATPQFQAMRDRCTEWLPFLLSASKMDIPRLLKTLLRPYASAAEASEEVAEREDEEAERDVLQTALEELDASIKVAEERAAARDPCFGLLSTLAEGCLQACVDAGNAHRRLLCAEPSASLTKIEFPCGLSTTYDRAIFEPVPGERLIGSRPTTGGEGESGLLMERIGVMSALSKMGECTFGERPGDWEVTVEDDLVDLYGVLPVCENAPRNVTFNSISDNLRLFHFRYDNEPSTVALREHLRRAHREWLETTDQSIDENDCQLRFGCLPFRAALLDNCAETSGDAHDALIPRPPIAPGGHWPWDAPSLQYVTAQGRVDKMLLESQWFSLGLKRPLYRTLHYHPLQLAAIDPNLTPVRVVPARAPPSLSRYDVLNNSTILHNPSLSHQRNAGRRNHHLQTSRSREDIGELQHSPDSITTTTAAAGNAQAVSAASSVVGPGLGWQKSALVVSGLERLIDRCPSPDSELRPSVLHDWGGSLRRRDPLREGERMVESTVWSYVELLVFANSVHRDGFQPLKLLPLLANCSSGDWATPPKTARQCAFLITLISSWISAAAAASSSSQFDPTQFLDPLFAFVNRGCDAVVGFGRTDRASVAQIIAFKKLTLAEPRADAWWAHVDDELALRLAAERPPPPLRSHSRMTPAPVRSVHKNLVPAHNSLILPPKTRAVIVHSGNELSVFDRTGDKPTASLQLIERLRHQITKPLYLDEDLKARVAAYTLSHPDFIQALKTAEPTDSLLKLFLSDSFATAAVPEEVSVEQGLAEARAEPSFSAAATPSLTQSGVDRALITTPPLLANPPPQSSLSTSHLPTTAALLQLFPRAYDATSSDSDSQAAPLAESSPANSARPPSLSELLAPFAASDPGASDRAVAASGRSLTSTNSDPTTSGEWLQPSSNPTVSERE